MRIGLVALLQESNTFLREPTSLDRFEQDLLAEGEEVRRRLAGTHHEVGGFFEGLAEAGVEAVPVFAARALPFGVVTAEAFAALLGRMFAALDRAVPLDGVLVAPHGATVSAAHPDADGHWLSELRARLGPRVPIIGTLDPHANLSPRMTAACNALVAYRTNPHLDQKQRGRDAAALLVQTLRGEVRPTMAAAFPPLAINIECQLTSEPPCLPLYQLADEMLRRPGVLSDSILLGFPYADVAEMGSSVLVVTNDDVVLARDLANELASHLWQRRHEFVGRLTGVAEAVERAAGLDGPVCLLDMGDNVGGGSPGDGTVLAHALRERGVGPAFVCLSDPRSVAEAEAAGVGAEVRLRSGGKTDDLHGSPLEGTFTVLGLHDGRFEEPEARHGGFRTFDQGRTAVVRGGDGLTLMLTSRRMTPFSLRQLTTFGVDPAAFRVLVAKGVHAPVAAYAPVCRHLLRVNTPGVTTADLAALDFRHRRRPLFPFEPEAAWGPPIPFANPARPSL
jgi:microcystin degradation protein MlrC